MMLALVIDRFAGGGDASAGIAAATEPPAIAERLEFCRLVEEKAKDPAQ